MPPRSRFSFKLEVNYAPEGHIVGIEILDASVSVFRSGEERKVVVQNLAAVTA